MERRGIAQARPNDAQPGPHARGTTEGQALVEHLDGVRRIPLGEVQPTETAMGNDRCLPSAFERGEAECLLAMTPALGEGPERAQGLRQPRPRLDPPAPTGRARLSVRDLHNPRPNSAARPKSPTAA